jgi:hypothetical protein
MDKSVQALVGCAAVLVCLYVLDKDQALANRLGELTMLVVWVGLPLLLLILGGAWVWDTVTEPSRTRRRVREITEEHARQGLVWDEARGEWVFDEERAHVILDAGRKPGK